jgi:hypothetical protein
MIGRLIIAYCTPGALLWELGIKPYVKAQKGSQPRSWGLPWFLITTLWPVTLIVIRRARQKGELAELAEMIPTKQERKEARR